MQAFVDYLKENKPDATIAVLRANDDFGAVVLRDAEVSWSKGTDLTIVQTSRPTTPRPVRSTTQVTSLAATQRRRVRARRDAARVPDRAHRRRRRGLEADHVHVGHVHVEDADDASPAPAGDGVLSVTPLMDPNDPAVGEQRRR